MTREVRANLIFVVCLVILCAPGFGILMYRKLTGISTGSNALPDPVPVSTAYVQPLPAPPLKRIEPRVARDWVVGLVRAHAGEAAAMNLDNEPLGSSLLSDAYVTQFAALSFEGAKSCRVSVIRWDDRVNYATQPKPTIAIDFTKGHIDFVTDTAEAIEVPKTVRHALQDVGYVDPPDHVWWISATGTPSGDLGTPKTLTFNTQKSNGKPITETMTFRTPATLPTPEVSR